MERKLLWNSLILMLCGFHQNAISKSRYIVKIRSESHPDSLTASALRAANHKAFIYESRRGLMGVSGAKDYKKLGVTILEGREEDIERSLNNHPLVEYYEKEKFWKTAYADANSLPSSQDKAPWLESSLGLDIEDPDETLVVSSPQTIVAVVDTGTTYTHPFLEDAITENSAEISGSNGVDDDGNGYVDDKYGGNVLNYNGSVIESASDHGTHVAGLVKVVRDQAIAEGFSAAQRVSILPVRFISSSGVGSTSGAIEALDYSYRRGAKVINASWGAKGTGAFSQALYDSIVELYNEDIVIAVAAGNYENGKANNNDNIPYFPSSYNIPSLISVASLTPEFKYSGSNEVFKSVSFSSFSNYGKNSVDISTPGSFKDADGDESGVFSANGRFPAGSGTKYIRKRGTSMATPVIAGIAGVIRAINPSLTAYEVKKVIMDSADKASKFNYTKSSASANARRAFERAASITTKGLTPKVPSKKYYGEGTQSANSAGGGGGGGCMSVHDLSSKNSSGNGPMGGNSLLLFTFAYFIYINVRNRRKQVKFLSRD